MQSVADAQGQGEFGDVPGDGGEQSEEGEQVFFGNHHSNGFGGRVVRLAGDEELFPVARVMLVFLYPGADQDDFIEFMQHEERQHDEGEMGDGHGRYPDLVRVKRGKYWAC